MNRARPDAPRCPATPAPRPPPLVQCAAIDARKLTLARRFRGKPTPTEAAAWLLLRGRRTLGLKFRRQHVIAGFIVDFYCASLRLALELDGGIHDDPRQAEYDVLRTQILSTLAIDVLRLRGDQINERALRELLAPYSEPPSPVRERGVGG
jgi:very-short-patch-repair endonuclease